MKRMKASSTTVACPAEMDGLVIDMAHDWEVAYWTRKLGVKEEELQRAVAAVGNRMTPVVSLLIAEGAPREP